MIQYKKIDIQQIKKQNIYIWGAGTWGRRCFKYLKTKEINVKGFFDNAVDKWNSEINDITVYSPNELQLLKSERDFYDILFCRG